MLQGFPNTCIGIIATVFGLISSSILAASKLKVSFSISQKMGEQFSNFIAVIVAIHVKGEVIISPLNFKPLMAPCNAEVPLGKVMKCFALNLCTHLELIDNSFL